MLRPGACCAGPHGKFGGPHRVQSSSRSTCRASSPSRRRAHCRCCRSCSARHSDRPGKLRPVFIAAGFVGVICDGCAALSALTRVFDFDPNVLREGAAALLAVFGLLMIWPAPFEWLSIRLAGLMPHNTAANASRPAGPARRIHSRHDIGTGVDAVRRSRARLDPHCRRDIERHRMGLGPADRLRRRCRDPMLIIAYGGQP